MQLEQPAPLEVSWTRRLTCGEVTMLSRLLFTPAEPGSAMLEHFNHLRRQWASKAQALLANLQKITSTNVDRVLSKSLISALSSH